MYFVQYIKMKGYGGHAMQTWVFGRRDIRNHIDADRQRLTEIREDQWREDQRRGLVACIRRPNVD